MEPIPETARAIEELEATVGEGSLLMTELRNMAEQVQAVVPECVGMSVSVLEHEATFTLVATSDGIRDLDATQYVDGGPCVQAIHKADIVETHRADMAEEDWQLFAQATAARGIASTLSIPILTNGQVTGGVNLYASTDDAFTGHHEKLAAILGGWAQGAVTNADLSFTTRKAAENTPDVLRDSGLVATAAGVLSNLRELPLEHALERIRRAAVQAVLPEAVVAKLILQVLQPTEA